jgi:hypothetical protein
MESRGCGRPVSDFELRIGGWRLGFFDHEMRERHEKEGLEGGPCLGASSGNLAGRPKAKHEEQCGFQISNFKFQIGTCLQSAILNLES